MKLKHEAEARSNAFEKEKKKVSAEVQATSSGVEEIENPNIG